MAMENCTNAYFALVPEGIRAFFCDQRGSLAWADREVNPGIAEEL